MFSGYDPLTKYGKNGISDIPITKIISPIHRYTRLYNPSSALISLTLPSAIGLYIAYTIAEPNPNSARLIICNIDENKLDNPRYSIPILRIIK